MVEVWNVIEKLTVSLLLYIINLNLKFNETTYYIYYLNTIDVFEYFSLDKFFIQSNIITVTLID